MDTGSPTFRIEALSRFGVLFTYFLFAGAVAVAVIVGATVGELVPSESLASGTLPASAFWSDVPEVLAITSPPLSGRHQYAVFELVLVHSGVGCSPPIIVSERRSPPAHVLQASDVSPNTTDSCPAVSFTIDDLPFLIRVEVSTPIAPEWRPYMAASTTVRSASNVQDSRMHSRSAASPSVASSSVFEHMPQFQFPLSAQTFSRMVSCTTKGDLASITSASEGQARAIAPCEPVVMAFVPTIATPGTRYRVLFKHALPRFQMPALPQNDTLRLESPESGTRVVKPGVNDMVRLLGWMVTTQVVGRYRTVNPEFTDFSVIFRAIFCILALFALLVFVLSMRRLPLRLWASEQRWVSVLLLSLFFFDNPFFVITAWHPSAALAYCDVVFRSTYLALLLLVVLVLSDLHLKANKRASLRFRTFYLPKMCLLAIAWFVDVSNSLQLYLTSHPNDDPAASEPLAAIQVRGVRPVFALRVAITATYIVWLLYILTRIASKALSARAPYAYTAAGGGPSGQTGLTFRFSSQRLSFIVTAGAGSSGRVMVLWTVTITVVVAVAVGLFSKRGLTAVGELPALPWLVLYTAYNIFPWLLAFFYSPAVFGGNGPVRVPGGVGGSGLGAVGAFGFERSHTSNATTTSRGWRANSTSQNARSGLDDDLFVDDDDL
eukprot:TRINITY_DN21053_c0_g1_i1.p1 TRINITY_DN21053_c0_g1~~TRINITY_DN21053_c0_g1_i1.p1  ORF type:complete len:662 (-),score=19.92 TRINITY_DN21053_c0_g1_i1:263-2248(-)